MKRIFGLLLATGLVIVILGIIGLVVWACIIDAGQTPDKRQQAMSKLMTAELDRAKPGDIMVMTNGTICAITVKLYHRVGFRSSKDVMTQDWTIDDLAPKIDQVVHQHEVPQYGYKCQDFVRSMIPKQ